MQVDPQSTEVFRRRIARFKPRLILNMIDDPKDADKAQKSVALAQNTLGLNSNIWELFTGIVCKI